jgi:hypothetical protein
MERGKWVFWWSSYMKTTFRLLFVSLLIIPNMPVSAAGIVKIIGNYDTKENSSISSKITIDVTKLSQTVDKKFYGSHVDSYSQLPSKTLVDELQLGKLRIGGNEFDVNNWKINKSVNANGDIITIPGFENLAKSMANYNVDGIFQINLTGFQPEVSGQNYVIKRTFSADSAYEMIKYLNGKLNLKIVDISLGNEFSIWNETHSKIWPSEDGITADEYIDRYIRFAIAIRKAQEEISGNANQIKLWGPEISTSWYDWNTGNFSRDCQWTDTKGEVECTYGNGKFTHFLPYFFSRLKTAENDISVNPKKYKLLDYLSIHYYPNFRTKIADPKSIIQDESGNQRIASMLESTRVFNDPTFINKFDISSFRRSPPNILGRVKFWMEEGYPDAKLAINEFAVDSDYRTTTYHPIVIPLYLADSIGIFINEGVSFLNQFMLSSPKVAHAPWAMIEDGERSNLLYMYKLFTNNFKGSVLDVKDNMGDLVNAYATIQGKSINLAIVNKDPHARDVQIYIKDSSIKKIITFHVPAWSASILKFEQTAGMFSKKFEIFEFGASEMGISR